MNEICPSGRSESYPESGVRVGLKRGRNKECGRGSHSQRKPRPFVMRRTAEDSRDGCKTFRPWK